MNELVSQGELCKKHEEMLREIHIAVCGNERLGVPGLVEDVREIKRWRRSIDLRAAKISGGICVLFFLAKILVEKL
jgi:hypothetical protein